MFFRFFTAIFSCCFFIAACSPEDGLCSEKKYSESNGFTCSQIDSYFSTTGTAIADEYTSKIAVYSATYVLDKEDVPGSSDVTINKPDNIPYELEFEKMTSCSIAPSIGGINCKEWCSFTFVAQNGEKVTFSSRNGDDLSNRLSLKYVFLKSEDLSLKGYTKNGAIYFYDEIVIDETPYDILHKFLLVEK